MRQTLSAPELVEIEITDRCNFQCIYCNVCPPNIFQKRYSELSFPQMKYILDMLYECDVFKLGIGGGEPLLHPNIIDILKYSLDLGFSVLLMTNGSILNQNIIKKMEKVGLEKIQVSLNTINPKKFELISGKRRYYKKVIENIKRLSNSSISVQINTVLMRNNIKEIPEILDFCLDVGVDVFRVCSLVPINSNSLKLQVDKKELKFIIDFLIEKQREYKNDILIIPPTTKFLFTQYDTTLLSKISKEDELLCEAGTVLCTITSNGDVIPCTYFRSSEFIAGNVMRDSFKNIWHNSPVLNMFRALGKLPPECSNCKIKSLCRGGCRAIAFYQLGNLKARDPRCWL